jgi:hypothetical protein
MKFLPIKYDIRHRLQKCKEEGCSIMFRASDCRKYCREHDHKSEFYRKIRYKKYVENWKKCHS